MMYWTILYRPQLTQRLYLTVLLDLYFYRYSQLEFSITDSIQWMIERFRLGFGMTESYTFSMLFLRKSGRSQCYSMCEAMDSWISFWLVVSSALSWVPFLRRKTQNLGVFSQKVVMINSSNFLDYSLQRRFCIMLQTSFSLALSFQYPLSINPLYFSSTSLTMMLSGLSQAISILGMYSIVSTVPTCLIFPSSSKDLYINSKLLLVLTLVNLMAWFRQISTSPKFLSYMWIYARRSHIQNWLY